MPRIVESFNPFWTAIGGDVRMYLGDVLEVLGKLPKKSVHSVVTSPPYWGLRDYQTNSKAEIGSESSPDCGIGGSNNCGVCHVCVIRQVFRGVHEVLRDDGTVWLNYGDSYSVSKRGRDDNNRQGVEDWERWGHGGGTLRSRQGNTGKPVKAPNLQSGNLVGVPWRVALALQADGWILRQDIIWRKPSPMPESVTNRCTKSHEYIFLLTKKSDYYYDQESIKEPASDGARNFNKPTGAYQGRGDFGSDGDPTPIKTANKRDVWSVCSQGFEGAHFACFPPKLIEPCILAGTPEKVCAKCSEPYTRVVETEQLTRERPNDYVKRTGESGTGNSCSNSVAGVSTRTVGWQQHCKCVADVSGGTVLDPFMGSGTTAVVALLNGRKAVGIELSETYIRDIAIPRIEGACLQVPDLAAQIGNRQALAGGASF